MILQIRDQLILPYPVEDWHNQVHCKIHWHHAQFVFAHIPLQKRLIKGVAHYLWNYFRQATKHAAPRVNSTQDSWQHPTCDETWASNLGFRKPLLDTMVDVMKPCFNTTTTTDSLNARDASYNEHVKLLNREGESKCWQCHQADYYYLADQVEDLCRHVFKEGVLTVAQKKENIHKVVKDAPVNV